MSDVDVFISYKREERPVAKALADALIGRGYRVWWDVELLPGERFAREIAAVIDQCACALVLWSPASVESDWVLDEAQRAHGRGVLTPVRIAPVDLPLGFGRLHTHDLTTWDRSPEHAALDPVIRAVEQRAGVRTAPAPDEDAALAEEVRVWREAQASGDRAAIEAYVKRYGASGVFFSLITGAQNVSVSDVASAASSVASAAVDKGLSALLSGMPVVPAAAPARPPRFAETWTVEHAFKAVPGDVQTVVWSPDGTRLAAEGVDSPTVTVWDPVEGRAVSAFPGPSEEARPNCLTFSPDGAMVAAGYNPDTHIFDAETGEERLVLRGERAWAGVKAVAWARGAADLLVTVHGNNVLAAWDGERTTPMWTSVARWWSDVIDLSISVSRHEFSRVRRKSVGAEAQFSSMHSHFVRRDGTLVLGDADDPITEVTEHDWVRAREGFDLVSREHGLSLDLVERASDRTVRSISVMPRATETLQVFKRRRRRASVPPRFLMIMEGARVRLWSGEDGGELAEFGPDGAWVRTARFSPDGFRIATGDSDGVVRVWRQA